MQDPRNEKPVVFLTNLKVTDDLSAIVAFGYYLERWGKGVSRKGHINLVGESSTGVRGSSPVAREAA